MKLKDFYETFKSDLTDKEFVIGYLEDALEEGSVSLFISALRDVVIASQEYLNNQLFNDFLNKAVFLERLRNSGFIINELDMINFSQEVFTKHGIAETSILYIVNK